MEQGDPNAAGQLFQDAIAQDPRRALAYYDLGVVYQRRGLTGDALLAYQHAISAQPDYVAARYNEAIIEAATNPARAMSLYREVISVKPDSATALLNLGLLEATAHEQANAIADMRRAVRLDPSLASRVPEQLRARVVG